MNAEKHVKDSAVSPVVGVMLMLVVTIVIAALVASFAGGLRTSAEPTPMLTFTADLSVKDGLTLMSTGATPGKNIEFDICIGDAGNYYKVSGPVSTSTFSAGTEQRVTAAQLDTGFTNAYGTFDGYKGTGMYVPNPSFIGKTYTISLMTKDGKIIGKNYATLKA